MKGKLLSCLFTASIEIVDWIVLLIYALFLIAVGWYYSYRQKSKEDYFLGGRSINPFLSGISLYVSFFSTISYLAVPGEVVQYGPLYPLGVVAATPVIYFLAGYFLVPFFMDLKTTSAYEILEKPLGKEIRLTASWIFIITRFLWMALLMFLASKAVAVMLGWDNIFTIIITLSVVTLSYTIIGGLKAVIMTDVIQFFILLVGAVFTIGIIAFKLHGQGTLIQTEWFDTWKNVDLISFDPYVRLTVFFVIIDNITWWLCTTGSDQMAIQRFLSTKDLRSARRTLLFTQIGQASIILLLMLVGYFVMNFYVAYPNLLPSGNEVSVNSDLLFPHFIATRLPAGMSGLVIAALFSASMSSLSSGVNSMSSIITTDILPKLFNKSKNADNLRNIRISILCIGMIVILLSLFIQFIPGNILEVTSKTNGLFIAPLFNFFFCALFIKNARPFSAFMGSVYGLLVAFTIGFWDVLTDNPSLSFLWIGFASLFSSVLCSTIFNLLPKKKNNLIWIILLMIPWVVLYCFLLI